MALLIPLVLALRRGRFALSGPDAMALLALLALLRCGLDPVNNIYYHAPFLLALLGWDSLEGKGVPLRALAATAVAAAFWGWAVDLRDPAFVNAAYTAAFLGATLAIAAALARAPLSRRRLERGPSSRPRTQPAQPA
jgi:hypothetical protein